jgi:hypothetical protein
VPHHDPRREIEKLRDHLASHDKPLAFLIGAGASCAAKDATDPSGNAPLVPPIAPLGAMCADAVQAAGAHLRTAFDAIAHEIATVPVARGWDANIEEILSAVRAKRAALGPADKLAGVDAAGLHDIEVTIQRTIATAAVPDENRVPTELPHHQFARWVGRIDRQYAVEVFTTNYDTLLERALEHEWVPVFDGFVGSREPFFSSASLLHRDAVPGVRWTRLWKIHGSVTWARRADAAGRPRIVRVHEHKGGELILPSFHKYDESRKQPYLAILDHLQRVLTAREDTVLFTLGYSFSDQHINEIIFDALDAQHRMHVVALQFEDLPDDHDLVKRAKQRSNLVVYGPTRAIVGGTLGSWRLNEEVDSVLATMLDLPFDSDAEPDPDAAALTGRFRLGDFAVFGRFLATISGSS